MQALPRIVDASGLRALVTASWDRTWGLAPAHPLIDDVEDALDDALRALRRTTASYHDVHHTLGVVELAVPLFEGQARLDEDFGPADAAHGLVALAYHDIGYVRTLLEGDAAHRVRAGCGDGDFAVDPARSDAVLKPVHVDRGIARIHARYAAHPRLDAARLAACVDRTRYPVPAGDEHAVCDDLPGLCRAADLLGQVADPSYLDRIPALFHELQETGETEALGYDDPAAMRRGVPEFYEVAVAPYVGPALAALRTTPAGRVWIGHLDHQLARARHG